MRHASIRMHTVHLRWDRRVGLLINTSDQVVISKARVDVNLLLVQLPVRPKHSRYLLLGRVRRLRKSRGA